jgi:4-hydroxy-3-polyprenylbenzoate decarboxylase
MAEQETTRTPADGSPAPGPGYADLHEHIARLDAAGLLYRIDEPVNKDTEMHPLVGWQFHGGIPEAERKAFLFTNIVDRKGRKYDIPAMQRPSSKASRSEIP